MRGMPKNELERAWALLGGGLRQEIGLQDEGMSGLRSGGERVREGGKRLTGCTIDDGASNRRRPDHPNLVVHVGNERQLVLACESGSVDRGVHAGRGGLIPDKVAIVISGEVLR